MLVEIFYKEYSNFSLQYFDDVTTNEFGSWSFALPSGYIAIAARAYDYQYGVFITAFGIRVYNITSDTLSLVRNANIGSVRILFAKQ